MKVKIVFLGTGQAVPTSKRNHTAILVSWKNENMLFDCGEGTQRQFRKMKINPCKLTRIFISHWHGDHILGLPGLFQTLALNGYNKELKVYGPKGTKKFIKRILDMFIFRDKLKIKVEETKKIDEKEFLIQAEEMSHGTPCFAYSFIEKDKLRIKKDKIKKLKIPGKLIGKLASGKNIKYKGKTIKWKNISYTEKGKKITIIMDTRENKNAIKLAKDSDLLISESCYLDKDKDFAKRYGHLTAKQAAEIAKKAKVKRLILTHISQRYENNLKEIEKQAKKTFKNTKIAIDFMKVEV